LEEKGIIIDIIAALPLEHFYIAIFVALFLTGLGAPWPEDIILISAGFLVDLGFGNFFLATFAALIGILASDTMVYSLGYLGGKEILTKKPFNKIFKQALIEKIEKLFERWGKMIVFFGRFGAGLRSPIFFTCGISKFPYLLFILFDFLAAIISVPLFIYLGYFFSTQIFQLLDFLIALKKKLILVIIIGGLLFFILKKQLLKLIYKLLKIEV
jgi:membrane protein DedA with SNARE-associated domain